MMPDTLSQALCQLPSAIVSLLTSAGEVKAGELIARSGVLLGKSGNVRGARIALCGLSPESLVEALVAFDGIASAMLLLPASLDKATLDGLIEAAGCTHRLDADALRVAPIVSMKGAEAAPTLQTRWLLATSGTTGAPKLIEHTLASLTRAVKRDLLKGAEYTWGLLYDPCRFAGLQVVLQALLSGSRLALPGSLAFEDQLAALLAHRVNALSATPSLWRKLLMDDRLARLRLKQLTLGGEIADQQILDALKGQFPDARVVHIYASTEAGTGFVVQDGQAGFPSGWLNSGKEPLLRVSEAGHLLIKPAILAGGREIAGRLDAEGYLDTQDLVRVRGDRVHFLGRASGAINVGGNKVNPEEVENIIREVKAVADVRVFGKASSMMGQLVAAEVVLVGGYEPILLRKEILQHCREMLRGWQIPVSISFVEDLKANAAGKKERVRI